MVFKIPLKPTLLSTASRTNNANTVAFPDGPKDSQMGYLTGMNGDYGLPSGASVGVTIAG